MGMFSSIAKVAGPAMQIAGMATGNPMLSAAGSAIGQYGASKKLAQQAGETSQQYAARLSQAGQQGFFRPVDVKTLYGQSNFKVDPTTGQLTEAGYTASDAVQADQARFGNLMQTGLNTAEQAVPFAQQYGAPAQGLFNLGQDYLADTPEQARQNYMQQQMAALRPYDIEEEQRLLAMGFGRGTTGLSVGAGGNPMLKALQESRNRRGLQLAAGAEDAAQQQINFGTSQLTKASGLMGTGYDTMTAALSPYENYLAQQSGLEDMAQQPFNMGLNAGATAMTGQQYGANALQKGALDQSTQQLAGNQNRYDTTTGLLKNIDLLGEKDENGVSPFSKGMDQIKGLFSGFGGGPAPMTSNMGMGMSDPSKFQFGQRAY
jgi:hypothetical protein